MDRKSTWIQWHYYAYADKTIVKQKGKHVFFLFSPSEIFAAVQFSNPINRKTPSSRLSSVH